MSIFSLSSGLSARQYNDLAAKLDKVLAQQTQLLQKENHIMSQITDWAAKEQADLTSISATLDGIVTGIASLNKLIVDLQNSPGVLSASDQAALDTIEKVSADLAFKAQAISTAPPAATP